MDPIALISAAVSVGVIGLAARAGGYAADATAAYTVRDIAHAMPPGMQEEDPPPTWDLDRPAELAAGAHPGRYADERQRTMPA